MSDENTEFFAARARLLREINEGPSEREAIEAQHGQVWDTDQLQQDFEVDGFLAPCVVVVRKSDRKRGSLMFRYMPRFYFNFQENSG